MPDYLSYFPEPFLDDIVQGRCIPFVGAGFSLNAKIPKGKKMLDWDLSVTRPTMQGQPCLHMAVVAAYNLTRFLCPTTKERNMVHLEPMTETQFQSYLDTAVEDYAQAHLKSGDCAPEDALRLAQKDYHELLPNGLQSKNHFLFSIHDDALGTNEIIGMVWFAVKAERVVRSAFIYDLSICENLRRKGYGRKVMERVEDLVQEMGIDTVGLHVFGHNHAARTLYEKMGYQITGIGMTKSLGKR